MRTRDNARFGRSAFQCMRLVPRLALGSAGLLAGWLAVEVEDRVSSYAASVSVLQTPPGYIRLSC